MSVKKLLAIVLAAIMLLGAFSVVYAAAGESANPEDGDVSVDIGDVEEIPEETEPEGLLGDVNVDGELNYLDLGALQAHLSSKANASNLVLADINGDGNVDYQDLGALQAHLSSKSPIA